ncbi:DUF4199 domain-containing protein [Arenibacter sp. GZD96]|uniref:DUF4199 domain-containing protein n=1 Tax=Aurantibrevibacter litoralis TaxID=3106030 RepID=UPI002AFEA7D6|nr:DUF4199 domain-containing protein [Arenibacter sp. GZD-96]MEA1786930.1 DUF4199 domain-containing protein [Arenibacter sp. GZD-96]
MEENQPKTGKFALTFGLLLGGLQVIFGLMLYSMDLHYQGGMSVIVVSIIMSLVLIILGLLQFKKANTGLLSFGQALKIGVGICLIGGIIGLIYNELVMSVIDPDTLTKALEYQKGQLLETTKLTSEQIDAQLEMGKKFSTPLIRFTLGTLFSIILGFLLTLIPALVLKKSENLN